MTTICTLFPVTGQCVHIGQSSDLGSKQGGRCLSSTSRQHPHKQNLYCLDRQRYVVDRRPSTRATDGDGEQLTTETEKASNETDPTPGPARVERERGQLTAIVTGAISVILGVAYLILVQVIDTRGVNMVPPPPEAYGE